MELEGERVKWHELNAWFKTAKGMTDEQLWRFPENLKEAMKRYKEIKKSVRASPATYRDGGLIDLYGRNLDAILALYRAEREGQKANLNLVFSIIAGAGAIVAIALSVIGLFKN
jgi:hypothetical protein